MKSLSGQIVLVVFVLGLFLLVALLVSTGTRDVAKFEFSVLMLRQAIGIFIATIAALMILLRALNKATISDVQTLLVAQFGGLILLNTDWPVTIPLGLVLVGLVVIAVIHVFKPVRDSSANDR